MQGHALYPGVSACIADGILVFLDINTEQYYGLSKDQSELLVSHFEKSALIDNKSRRPPHDKAESLIAALVKKKLLKETDENIAPNFHNIALIRPTKSNYHMAFGVEANPSLRDKLFVLFVHLSVMLRLKKGKLSELLLRDSIAQTTLSENEVSYFVSLYEEASVFSPWSGIEKCLFKSISLKRFLRSKGIESTLVIGIKTAPFYAHAWLQIGMTVINDDIDYVGDYSPIFAD